MNIFLAILIALVSGSASGLLVHFFESGEQKKLLLRQKGEALYGAFSDWSNVVSQMLVAHYPLFKGEITYDQFHDFVSSSFGDPRKLGVEPYRKETGQMLLHVYFPSLQPAWDTFDAIRSRMVELEFRFKREYKLAEVEDPRPYVSELTRIGEEMDRAQVRFLDSLAKAIRRV